MVCVCSLDQLCTTLYEPLQTTRLLCPWNFPGKNTGAVTTASYRDLPDPGIKPMSPMSPALAGRFFTTSATWEAPGSS